MQAGPRLRIEASPILRVVANGFKRKENSSMKRVVIVLTVGLIAGLLATQPKAFAQGGQVQISSEGAPTSDLPMADLQAFDQFRADHPEIAHALSHNPKLISSKSFQAKNPALRDFLSAHSGVETAFAENPVNFIPPGRGMGAAHHRRHHKAAKESAAKAGGEGGAAAAAASSPAGAPAAEGGGAPEAGGSPAAAEGSGGASSGASPAADASGGGH